MLLYLFLYKSKYEDKRRIILTKMSFVLLILWLTIPLSLNIKDDFDLVLNNEPKKTIGFLDTVRKENIVKRRYSYFIDGLDMKRIELNIYQYLTMLELQKNGVTEIKMEYLPNMKLLLTHLTQEEEMR
jgi:hypothetical protein